jgi:tRNA (cmo5U34)-methyltransferase
MTDSKMEEVKARFDRVAADWDSNPGRMALAEGVANTIQKTVALRSDMEVMDFGAGTGLLTLRLLPYVGRVTAVDISGEMVRVLNEKLTSQRISNVQTLLCDISTTPFPAAQFDLVVSLMAFHHIPDIPNTLKHLRPCLRPDGWIAVADLDSEDGSFHPDRTGVFHYGLDRNRVRGGWQDAGFVNTSSREAHRIARPAADGILHEYTVFLATGRTG